jgi:hypothetical protein
MESPSIACLLLLGLHVVKDHVQGGGLLTEVSDDGDGALHSLAHVALGIELGQAAPLADLSAGVGHDQVHARLGAQSLNQLLVLLVVAVLSQDAQTSSAGIQSLHRPIKTYRRYKSLQDKEKGIQGNDSLVQTTAKTVEDQSLLQDNLEGVNDAELARRRLYNLLRNIHSLVIISHFASFLT